MRVPSLAPAAPDRDGTAPMIRMAFKPDVTGPHTAHAWAEGAGGHYLVDGQVCYEYFQYIPGDKVVGVGKPGRDRPGHQVMVLPYCCSHVVSLCRSC